jgi:hypothetical protein
MIYSPVDNFELDVATPSSDREKGKALDSDTAAGSNTEAKSPIKSSSSESREEQGSGFEKSFSKDYLDRYEKSLRDECAAMVKERIDLFFEVQGNEYIGLGKEIPKNGFEGVERTDSPQLFYKKISEKPDSNGNFEVLAIIRENDAGREGALVCANIKVNPDGKRVEDEDFDSLIDVCSEKSYNETVKKYPRSMDAKWFRGDITADNYVRKTEGFLGLKGTLDEYLEKEDEKLRKGRDRWEMIANESTEDFLERMRGVYTEKHHDRNAEVEQIIEDSDKKEKTASTAQTLTVANVLRSYLKDQGSLNDTEKEILRDSFSLPEEVFKDIYKFVEEEQEKLRKKEKDHRFSKQGKVHAQGGMKHGNAN